MQTGNHASGFQTDAASDATSVTETQEGKSIQRLFRKTLKNTRYFAVVHSIPQSESALESFPSCLRSLVYVNSGSNVMTPLVQKAGAKVH